MSSSDSETVQSQVNTRPRRRVKMATPISCAEPQKPNFNIRIPPFWPEKPAIWFAQVEGQFAVANITEDREKFFYILTTLDRQYAAEVEDVLTGPPSYDILKSELIKRLSVSRENKVKQLLMHEELGNRKPSQFLRHLQHLAGPEIPEDFLKTIWTSRLPTSMQPIVASQPTLSLDALAELADRINDIAIPAQVAATTPIVATSSAAIEVLTQQVAQLTKQVHALTTQRQNRSRQIERGRRHRSRSTSTRSLSSYRRYPICWYHKKFSDKAHKCIKPCDFKHTGNFQGS